MNHRLRIVSLFAAILAGVLGTSPVRAAQPKTTDCLAASEASITLGNLHQLHNARSQLLVCSSASCPADIQKECLRRVEEVNRAIPTIIFAVKDRAGKDLSGVKVSMDGAVLAERIDGNALSIDPGEHTFTFEVPGQPTFEEKLVIREAEKERREPIVIGAPSIVASSPSVVAATSLAPQPQQPQQPAQSPRYSAPAEPKTETRPALGTQKALALVAGGVGVVGAVVGTIFGLQSKSKHDQADNNYGCSGSVCSDSIGITRSNEAVKAGNISTVAFVVSAAGLSGGAVLWFLAKAPVSSSPQVGLGLGNVQLRGVW